MANTKSSNEKPAYPEIDEIKADLNSLKNNVVELTEHVRRNGAQRADQVNSAARDKLGDVSEAGRYQLDQIEGRVKDNPGQSLLMAFASGFLASFLLRR